MKPLKMPACGFDCAECALYKVTMEQDLKAAELLVAWYRDKGWIEKNEGAEAVVKRNPMCKGCWNNADDCLFKCGCYNIDFRVCCKERQINHCGECGDFPCEDYKKWAGWDEIRQSVCCKEKQINHCGECGDFPCEHYTEWESWDWTHRKAMAHLFSLRARVLREKSS